MKWTDNGIYGERIIMIGELLKSNTTLIKLNLKSEKKIKIFLESWNRWILMIMMNIEDDKNKTLRLTWIGNYYYSMKNFGAYIISEALKNNHTLTSLDLSGEYKENE